MYCHTYLATPMLCIAIPIFPVPCFVLPCLSYHANALYFNAFLPHQCYCHFYIATPILCTDIQCHTYGATLMQCTALVILSHKQYHSLLEIHGIICHADVATLMVCTTMPFFPHPCYGLPCPCARFSWDSVVT